MDNYSSTASVGVSSMSVHFNNLLHVAANASLTSSFRREPGLKETDGDNLRRSAKPYLLQNRTKMGLPDSNVLIYGNALACHWALAVEFDGWWVVIEATQNEDHMLVPMYNKGPDKPIGSLFELTAQTSLWSIQKSSEIFIPTEMAYAVGRLSQIPLMKKVINISPFDLQEIAGSVPSNNTPYHKLNNNCQTWLIEAAKMLKLSQNTQ